MNSVKASKRSRDISVSNVTAFELDGEGLIPIKGRCFSLSHVQTDSEAHSVGTGLFPQQ
jgi:hypothetical protein